MVRPFGPLHERFEEYILERTADYPSVVPMVMLKHSKASFRLVCKDTLNHSNFSPWFDEASLYGGPGMMQLDHAIVVCLGELEEDRRNGVSVRELLRREQGGWQSAALANAQARFLGGAIPEEITTSCALSFQDPEPIDPSSPPR